MWNNNRLRFRSMGECCPSASSFSCSRVLSCPLPHIHARTYTHTESFFGVVDAYFASSSSTPSGAGEIALKAQQDSSDHLFTTKSDSSSPSSSSPLSSSTAATSTLLQAVEALMEEMMTDLSRSKSLAASNCSSSQQQRRSLFEPLLRLLAATESGKNEKHKELQAAKRVAATCCWALLHGS